MIFKNLNPFQNIVAGSTAVLPVIDQGMTYEQIVLVLGGTTFPVSDITGLRLWLGGKKIWDVTGSDLAAINAYYGITANALELPIIFADPNAKTLDEYLTGALDTSPGYSSFNMEVDIAAGASAPTLSAYAGISSPLAKDKAYAGMFRTLVKSIQSPSGVGQYGLPVPTGSAFGAFIKAIHYFNANITQLDVKKDSFALLQNGVKQVYQAFQAQYGRAIQAGLFSWDPLAGKEYMNETVPTLRSDNSKANFEHLVTMSAADTLRIYSDLYQTYAAA